MRCGKQLRLRPRLEFELPSSALRYADVCSQQATKHHEFLESLGKWIRCKNENPNMIRLRNKEFLRPQRTVDAVQVQEEGLEDPEEEARSSFFGPCAASGSQAAFRQLCEWRAVFQMRPCRLQFEVVCSLRANRFSDSAWMCRISVGCGAFGPGMLKLLQCVSSEVAE